MDAMGMKHLAIIPIGSECARELCHHLSCNANIYPFALQPRPVPYEQIAHHIESAELANKKALVCFTRQQFRQAKVPWVETLQALSDTFDFVVVYRPNYVTHFLHCVESTLYLKEKAEVSLRVSESTDDFVFTPATTLILPDVNYIEKFEKHERKIHETLSALRAPMVVKYSSTFDARATVTRISHALGFYDDYVYDPGNFGFDAKKVTYDNDLDEYSFQRSKWENIKIKDKVENYNTVAEQLQGTRYEWMVKE